LVTARVVELAQVDLSDAIVKCAHEAARFEQSRIHVGVEDGSHHHGDILETPIAEAAELD
jgi:hypothetical protein